MLLPDASFLFSPLCLPLYCVPTYGNARCTPDFTTLFSVIVGFFPGITYTVFPLLALANAFSIVP